MSLPRNLLVAIDLGARTERLLDTALALADRLDATVHLVHAFTLSELPESALRSMSDAEHVLERALEQLAEPRRASGRIGKVLVREGDPVVVLTKAAIELESDLLVVDTHHRGLRRSSHGHTVEGLVREAPCGVLVLREQSLSPRADMRRGRKVEPIEEARRPAFG